MMRPACRATLAHSELIVRPARAGDVSAIASIVGAGFDLPQRGAELFTTLVDRPQWHVYVAMSGEAIAAAAGMFIEGDVAYLAFAATRPEFQRRGAQRTLMHARINRAADAGCQWIATETGFPLAADEPNPSYQNLLWAGFRPVAIRDNYAPQGTMWRAG
jgi:ribosomal protein S18 acetylase RimI-like enzyme